PFEVVPGISSVFAAPNYAGVPLTHREHCSSFTVITGHEDPTKEVSGVDWGLIAKTPGTKVILMGAGRIRRIAELLVAHGMSPATPVAMIQWGTTGRQQSINATLADIADAAARAKLLAPTVTVIGDVVKLRSKLNWFESRSLFGQRIAVTRTREQASQLSRQLLERGAEVLEIPNPELPKLLEDKGAIVDDIAWYQTVPETEDITGAAAKLLKDGADWITFTSSSTVENFHARFDLPRLVKKFPQIKTASIGPE